MKPHPHTASIAWPLRLPIALAAAYVFWQLSYPETRLWDPQVYALAGRWYVALGIIAMIHATRSNLALWLHGVMAAGSWTRIYAEFERIRFAALGQIDPYTEWPSTSVSLVPLSCFAIVCTGLLIAAAALHARESLRLAVRPA